MIYYLDIPTFIRLKREKKLRPYIKIGVITEQEMRRIIKDEFSLDMLARQQSFKIKKHSSWTIVS